MNSHGAGPDNEFTHIAIGLNPYEGEAEWLGPVKVEEHTVLDEYFKPFSINGVRTE